MNEITVEHLKNEAESEHTFFTEFALAYNKTSNKLYSFYEGFDDTKYYSIRIKNITKINNYQWFYCAGKENTISAYDMISKHEEYDMSKILLFIDKDYSEKIENDKIYCTPVYSVENFYTNKEVLENILTEEFKLKKEDSSNDDYNKAIELYIKLSTLFHDATTFFNSWLACQNDIRIERNEKKRLHIDDKVKEYFRNIVSVDLNSISDFTDLNDKLKLEQLFPEAPKVNEDVLNAKINEFKALESEMFFRGKFELKFFVSFLDRLRNELGKRNSLIFSKKYKINLILEYSSAISILSQYAISPICLIQYLERYKNAA